MFTILQPLKLGCFVANHASHSLCNSCWAIVLTINAFFAHCRRNMQMHRLRVSMSPLIVSCGRRFPSADLGSNFRRCSCRFTNARRLLLVAPITSVQLLSWRWSVWAFGVVGSFGWADPDAEVALDMSVTRWDPNWWTIRAKGDSALPFWRLRSAREPCLTVAHPGLAGIPAPRNSFRIV